MSDVVPQVSSNEMVLSRHGIVIRSIDDLRRFAETVAKSGFAPRGLESPAAIAVAIEMGLELGLSPFAALQNIAVINGRPALFGDAPLALCVSHPCWDAEAFREELIRDAHGNVVGARCTVRRKPGRPIVREFMLDDAKRARLFERKDSAWLTYPSRMLQMRARSWALRDAFPDVLKGFRIMEEYVGVREEPARSDVIDGEVVAKPRADVLAERLSESEKENGSEGIEVSSGKADDACNADDAGNDASRKAKQLFEETSDE